MSGFLYYLPDGCGLTAKAFGDARRGIVGESLSERTALDGPDGKGGLVLAIGSHPAHGYYPKSQTWMQADAAPWWIGFDVEHAPTPEDLQRSELLAGHDVQLEDGNAWHVPAARLWVNEEGMPRYRMSVPVRLLRRGGEWKSEPLERYRWLADAAETYWAHLVSGQGSGFTVPQACELAVRALSVNYRLGPEETSALALLTDRNVLSILNAIVDWPRYLEISQAILAEKKTASARATGDTGSGEPASPQATPPHSPI